MPTSSIVLTFTNWDSGDPTGTTINFKANGVDKNEVAVLVRVSSGQFNVSGDNNDAANNYKNAWQADYATGFATITRLGNVVTITAIADGVEFTDFVSDDPGRVSEVIDNVAFDPPFELETATIEEADTNPCTTIKVVLTESEGVPPFTWVSPLPGNVGLEGTIPRSGGDVTITVEDDNADQSFIVVSVPAVMDNTAIDSINIEGDPSGLYGTVSVLMNSIFAGVPLVFMFSMDNITFQSSNVFTSVLPGTYTMYIKDQFGCTISEEFEVSLTGIRPPVYRLIPRSNSFGWFETQAAVTDCANPYNGTNAKPNDYKPTRFYNPKYFQPWCTIDAPKTQFRSNYDTLVAKLINIATDAEVATLPIVKMSNNIGQRQRMDAKIYDKGSGQTGVYWLAGNIYEDDGVTVSDTYDLSGQLPEWAKVGQKFFLSGSVTDGLFEIKQIIYDSTLLVNAAVIDRVYTDLTEPVTVGVDATYNRVNYETYEFVTDLSALSDGCYKVTLVMSDSLLEYPTSSWETLPMIVTAAGSRDHVYIESSDNVDDGILYSTGIIHKQRFQGLFYEEDFPLNLETSRDSRKQLNNNDGRVRHVFILEAIDVPFWVHEKLSLFISKKVVRVNNIVVGFEDGFERERSQLYSRVNLRVEADVKDYEQYVTNAYDIL